MLSLAAGVILGTLLIYLLATLIPGVEVENIEAAFWTAVIVTIIDFGAMAMWEFGGVRLSLWSARAVHLAFASLALGVAALAVDGFKVRNPISLVLLAAVFTVVNMAILSALATTSLL